MNEKLNSDLSELNPPNPQSSQLLVTQELEARARQQAALAQFTQAALAGVELSSLFNTAVVLMQQTLQVDYTAAGELLADQNLLLVRAGSGWQEGYVGQELVPIGIQSLAGYTMLINVPIVVEEWDKETRFSKPLILQKHNVVSSMTVIIPGKEQPFGTLAAHSITRRSFSKNDLNFLQALANVLATVIDRNQIHQAERQARQEAEEAVKRTARLLAITAAFSQALTTSQVVQVMLEQGLAELGADAGTVRRLVANGTMLDTVKTAGYPEGALRDYQQVAVEAALPLAVSVRTGQAIFIESLEALFQDYPHMRELIKVIDFQAFALVPLITNGQPIGTLNLSFNEPHQFNEEDKLFVQALAQHCAHALERARLYEAEQEARAQAELARQRLAFQAEFSALLAASLDYLTTLEKIAQLVVPYLADICVVELLEEGSDLRRVASAHVNPAKAAIMRKLNRTYPRAQARYNPTLEILSTGQAIFIPEITAEVLAAYARDPEHQKVIEVMGPHHSSIIVPLMVRGELLGAITFGTTESGRRYTQADLAFAEDLGRRASQALDNARLYEESQAAVRTQQELDGLKNLLMSTATHELRNPLTSIRGYAQIVLRNLTRPASTNSPASVEKTRSQTLHAMEVLLRQTERMDRLVGELLDFSRITNAKLELNYEESVGILELVQRVVEQFRLTSSDHTIVLATGSQDVVGAWDALRLEQVITNLVSNAIKYSPSGTQVTIGVDYCPASGVQTEEIVIFVKDQGYGISEEHQAHIFKSFYRIRTGQTSKVEGLGLGLYITHEIVVNHGGRMWLESKPGVGSTFYFAIPVRQQLARLEESALEKL